VKNGEIKIGYMKRRDIPACDEIVAVSEPWKTLHERVDFSSSIGLKQAYICSADDTPVGFVIFAPGPVFARGGYLRAIGVAPDQRGRGLGRKLMTFAETTTARQAPNLYLCVSSFNRRAQAFYRSLGYERAGKLPDLIAPGVAEYIYWKRLRSSYQVGSARNKS
jgi:ribosomal-protein-alanine N-acetyltransferase